jgi:20S proteasome subunit alpha 5
LQEKFREDLTLVQAEDLALEILKQVMEDKLSGVNVEVASVTAAEQYHLYSASEIQTIISRMNVRL